MARKKEHSRETIIEASLDMISKYGKENFSIRNVANHLNASTQPIYSYFTDGSSLYQANLLEIEKRLLAQISHPYTEYPFRNMGFGFTLFAKENPNLFDMYFNDMEMNKRFINKFLEKLREIVDNDPRFVNLSSKGKDQLLQTLWTFSYGYAFLIIKGLVKNASDEAIKETILETGTAMIAHVLKKEEL